MSVLEAIQKSAEFLAKKSVESPRLQTELLLAHLLKMPRMKLYLNFERQLSQAETDALRSLILRRAAREPLQHITGSTSFCGLEIAVNRHVLIPRPETELLAELGWKFLSTINSPQSTCLDFGTGSGCIAIAIAKKCQSASIVAIDLSAEAINTAQTNAASNAVTPRIEFRSGDGFSALKDGERFDLIVTNPPYIASAEIATLEPEVREFDPRGALDGGADGLEFYRTLAAQGRSVLKPHGKLMAEFGEGQAADIRAIFESSGWCVESILPDLTQRERFIVAKP